LLATAGCATTPRRAEIPCGRWSGQGRFVLHRWEAGKSSEGAQDIVQHGEYPTTLKIETAPADDQPGYRVEILSQRGQVKTLDGDRTHIVMRLRPTRDLADGAIVLYELAEFGISDGPEAPEPEQGPAGRSYATCMLADGQVVLRVHYLDGFSDTFRFRGDALYKDGAYFVSDEGVIRWTEWLRRQRP